MPDDAVQTLQRSRTEPAERRNRYRHHGSLGELLTYLEEEQRAYAATGQAYRDSPERPGHIITADAARSVAEVLKAVIEQVQTTRSRTNSEDWSSRS
jgi:hypothetical protein